MTQLPDNSGNTNPNYGTATYNSILDGQGLYVTRSDDDYNGTFLFENNICVNNGKNGINFDNSLSASAIYRNNTLYLNGVHEYIQDLSVADGNPAHRGQNVAGIKANRVFNATVVNNIIVTRSLDAAPSYYQNGFSALQLNQVSGTRIANNNIFVNGSYAWPATETNNLIDVDPQFILPPNDTEGPIDMSSADFSLNENHQQSMQEILITLQCMISWVIQDLHFPMLFLHQVLKTQLEAGAHLAQPFNLLKPPLDRELRAY